MNDAVGEQLRRIVAEYGLEVCEDSRRVEALLRDLSGEHRREIFVLVGAAREGVPTELLAAKGTVPAPVVTERLARSLEENLGLGADAARWAVATWASALDSAAPPGPARSPDQSRPGRPGPPVREDAREPAAVIDDWLASLQPGQASDLGWSLLGVLAAAAGPLTVPEAADVLGTPVRTLHQAITPIKDLLVSQGNFDLPGPGWRAALAGYLGRAERQEGTNRLTRWCATWVTGGNRAEDVPAYVIAHASTHLRDAQDTEALCRLIDDEWRRLSMARTGSPRAFMRDMRFASECATPETPAARLHGLRATLALTAAASLAGRVPPEALAVIAAAGQHRRAMDLAGLLPAWERSDGYERIALALHRMGLTAEADDAASQALAAAELDSHLLRLDGVTESFRDHGPEGWALRGAERILAVLNSQPGAGAPRSGAGFYTAGKTAAGIFTGAGRLDEALQAASAGATDRAYRDEALTGVATALARTGRISDAVSATQTMSDNGRTHVMRELFGVICEVADVDGVLAAVDAIGDPDVQDQARQEAAVALARAGQAGQAMVLARGVTADRRRSYLAKEVPSALAGAGQMDRALELLDPDADERDRRLALTGVAAAVAAAGQTSQALRAVSLIPGKTEQRWATGAVVAVLAKSGNVTAVADLVDAAGSEYDRDELRVKAGQELAGAGHLHHAVEVAQAISDDGKRAQTLLRVAGALGQAGHHVRSAALAEEAATAARAARSTARQAEAFTAWAQALLLSARAEQAVAAAEQAVAAAEAADDPALLGQALATWASTLARSGRMDQAIPAAERAVTAAQAGDHDWTVNTACRDIAITLGRAGLAVGAISAARALDDYQRDQTLTEVARELARRGLGKEAVTAAQALGQSWDQERILPEIADILARRGDAAQAMTAARAIADTAGETGRLVAAYHVETATERVALALAETGRIEDALSAAQAAGSLGKTHQIEARVAGAIARAGDLDRAVTVADAIPGPSARADAFGGLAEILADQGRPTDAVRLAEKAIDVALTRPADPAEAEALARLAQLPHAAGDIRAALDLAELAVSRTDPDRADDANAVVLAASVLADAGEPGRALGLAERATAAARKAGHTEVRAAILAAATPVLARAGGEDLAAAAARDALAAVRADPGISVDRSDVVAATVMAVLIAVADAAEALAALDPLEPGWRKAEAVAAIAGGLARHGHRDRLLGLAGDRHAIGQLGGADQAIALIGVAEALIVVGAADQAATLATEAGAQASGLTEAGDKARVMPDLALLLAHLGQTADAVAAAAEARALMAQVADGWRSRQRSVIVQALAVAGETGQALASARDATDLTQPDRAGCLLAIAAELAGAGDPDQAAALVDEAFAAIRDAQYSRAGFYRLLCDLVPHHPGLLRAWLPAEGEATRLARELAGIEAWWRS